MKSFAEKLQAAVRESCPVAIGVTIGNVEDRSTWGVFLPEGATKQERDAAVSALLAFDAEAALAPPTVREKLAAIGISLAELKAELAKQP